MNSYIIICLLFLTFQGNSFACFEFKGEFNLLNRKEKDETFVELHNLATIIVFMNDEIAKTEDARQFKEMLSWQLANPLRLKPYVSPIITFQNPMAFMQLAVNILSKFGLRIEKFHPLTLKEKM